MKNDFNYHVLKPFVNTSPSNETIQDFFVTAEQWGVKHVYFLLYKNMPCRLHDGQYTASNFAIDRSPETRNTSKYKEGHSFEINSLNKIKS